MSPKVTLSSDKSLILCFWSLGNTGKDWLRTSGCSPMASLILGVSFRYLWGRVQMKSFLTLLALAVSPASLPWWCCPSSGQDWQGPVLSVSFSSPFYPEVYVRKNAMRLAKENRVGQRTELSRILLPSFSLLSHLLKNIMIYMTLGYVWHLQVAQIQHLLSSVWCCCCLCGLVPMMTLPFGTDAADYVRFTTLASLGNKELGVPWACEP